MKTDLAPLMLASVSLLALSASVATASATPVPFIGIMPGSTTFTVPETAIYNILALGAQGGNSALGFGLGGLGAESGGDILLTEGEVLTIAVGGRGGNGITYGALLGGGGGGGGSFVVGPNSTPLVIAGGGGGGGQAGAGGPGQAGTSGQGAYYGTFGIAISAPSTGGVNGAGGFGGAGAGGGGGLYSSGFSGPAEGGGDYPDLSGGFGAAEGTPVIIGGNGGFGGGGGGDAARLSGGDHIASGGAGGGYSGGEGGASAYIGSGGGGGGSFNAGLNNGDLILVAGVKSGDGSVTITELPPTTVPEPGSLALLGTGVAGLLALRRRKR